MKWLRRRPRRVRIEPARRVLLDDGADRCRACAQTNSWVKSG